MSYFWHLNYLPLLSSSSKKTRKKRQTADNNMIWEKGKLIIKNCTYSLLKMDTLHDFLLKQRHSHTLKSTCTVWKLDQIVSWTDAILMARLMEVIMSLTCWKHKQTTVKHGNCSVCLRLRKKEISYDDSYVIYTHIENKTKQNTSPLFQNKTEWKHIMRVSVSVRHNNKNTRFSILNTELHYLKASQYFVANKSIKFCLCVLCLQDFFPCNTISPLLTTMF